MSKKLYRKNSPHNGQCLLCGEDAKLVDSHIIPRSFFPSEGGDGKILHVEGLEPPKRAPKGVYDQIVCLPCERTFSGPDDYAYRILGDFKPGLEPQFKTIDVDFGLLKRFVLALLWRASASKQSLYSSIYLGSQERRLTELVRHQSIGDSEDFSFYVARIVDVNVGVMKPVRRRYKFEHGYRNLVFFAFGSAAIYIKTDHRPMPGVLNELILRPGGPLLVPAVSLAALHLEEPILEMVRNNPNAFPRART